ncbi:MFS transporter [Streptomyces sp. DW26H14]|uniref:MFS transporter n=1 Tax=Streptomyces sp. DW26H14 TaxID=3435395 RepID=UPI00403DBA5E
METPGLGRYIAARTASMLGDRIAEASLPIIILLTTHDALLSGLVTAANLAPTLLMSVPVGHQVDLRERRKLMVGADLWRLVLVALLGLSLTASKPSTVVLLVSAFLIGCGDLVFSVSAQAYLPTLVPASRVMRANTALEVGDAAASLAGPAAAGSVVARLGPAAAIGLNAASFAVSAALLFRLPKRFPDPTRPVEPEPAGEPAHPVAESTGRAALAGMRLLIADPTQRLLQLGSAYMYLAAGSAELIVIGFALQDLRLGSAVTGLLLSAAGIGGLLTSLVVVRFAERARWGPLLGLALLGIAASALLMASTHAFPVAFSGVLLMDACSALAFIIAGSARQILTPPEVLGRLGAATAIVNGGVRALGAIGAGALILAVGARGALLVLAVCGLPAGLPLVAARTARTRMIEEPQPSG